MLRPMSAGSRPCRPTPRFRFTCTYRSAPNCASIRLSHHGRPPPVAAYAELLEREIDLIGARLAGQSVTHIHFGGGTPTVLQPNELMRIMAALQARFRITHATEIAIEIYPRSPTRQHIAALADMGVSRASLGVQDFRPARAGSDRAPAKRRTDRARRRPTA